MQRQARLARQYYEVSHVNLVCTGARGEAFECIESNLSPARAFRHHTPAEQFALGGIFLFEST